MKGFIRLLFILTLGLLIALAGVYVSRDTLLLKVLPRILETSVGVKCSAKTIQTQPFRGIVELKGFWMENPKGFPAQPPILLADRIYLDLLAAPLFGSPVIFESALLDVGRVVVVRNHEGKINWKKLGESAKSGEEPSNASSPRQPIRFDRLDLSIKDLQWIDQKHTPTVDMVIPLNIKHLILTNVTEEELAVRIVAEVIKTSKGKFLNGVLLDRALAVPDPVVRETKEAVEKIKNFGGRLKEKLGL